MRWPESNFQMLIGVTFLNSCSCSKTRIDSRSAAAPGLIDGLHSENFKSRNRIICWSHQNQVSFNSFSSHL